MINSPMINPSASERRPRAALTAATPSTAAGAEPGSVRLRLTEAVPLAHAMVADVAARKRISALGIKGPVLACHGLRVPRPSADADILVAPDQLADLVATLTGLGWQERYERPIARILDDHSVTLTNPDWPCDVDLHWYFPGMFADPQEAFAFLWSGRTTVELAHRTVPVAGRVDAAAIAALHALRHPDSIRHRSDLADLVARLRSDWQSDDELRLRELISRCGATATLAPFAVSLGVAVSADVDRPAQLAAWRAYTGTHDQGSTGAWLYVLRRARWSERPRLVMRALYPTRRELIAEHGRLSLGRRWSLRTHRWQRGLHALPQAISVLRGTRRRS